MTDRGDIAFDESYSEEGESFPGENFGWTPRS
jgi:hypothetical protein